MRLLWFRRNEVMAVIVGAALWGLIFVGGRVLITKQIRLVENELLSVETKIAKAEEMLSRKDAVAQTARDIGLFNDDPEINRAGLLMKLISERAQNAGVDVKILRPLGAADPEAVTLSGQGTWNDVVTFLSVLQSKPHYVDVEELRIMKTASYSAILSIEMILARAAL